MQLFDLLQSGGWRVGAVGDDEFASDSHARLLITAAGVGAAEKRARRIHALGRRHAGPFVRIAARDLPIDVPLLRLRCAALLEDAAGGTLFIDAVDLMPAEVQNVFLELLVELGPSRDAPRAVRLVSGTSVSLRDCVVARTFAEGLFYRLNVIHLRGA